jgi:hypothetical protein
MEAIKETPPPIESVAAAQKKEKLVFNPGQLVPLNGVWFQIERVEKEGLFLKAVGFTKNRGRK